MDWSEVTKQIYPVLASALVSVLVLLIRAAQRWIEGKIAGDRHMKAASIVLDAVLAAIQQLGPQWVLMMADGKISADEWAVIRGKAREIALDRLSDLRGFAAHEASEWIEQQIDISLGKLATGLGLPLVGPTIGPDDPAI